MIFSLSCSSSEGDKDSSTVSQEDGAVIVAMDGGGGVMSLDDFQALPSDRQSEEIFKLLSMLSPFASEVTSLRSSMENALNRLDYYHYHIETDVKILESSFRFRILKSHLSERSSHLKKNGTQGKTPFSGTVFHTLSHGELRFVASVSFRNH